MVVGQCLSKEGRIEENEQEWFWKDGKDDLSRVGGRGFALSSGAIARMTHAMRRVTGQGATEARWLGSIS